jgi:SnoaL-like protein
MRWEFLLIGVLVTSALSLGARQTDSEASLEARTARLQAHIENVESVRAIKRLQYAYGHYVELGLWNDFADLFADEATTNYQQGVRGKEEVRKLFLQQVGQGKLGLADGRIYPHIVFQPVVHLSPSGRTAKGRWRILAMLGGLGSSATWYSGVYENEYVLDKGVWKISVLHSEPRVTAVYNAAGWREAGVGVPPHDDAASIAKPIPEEAGHVRTGGTTMSFAVLAVRVGDLARRAALLNDQCEIANLQDVYGYAIDRKQWEQAASLFSVDGTLEVGQEGVYVGQASIRRGLNRRGPPDLLDGERNDHIYLQTLVSVAADGRTANARGVELIFSAAPGGANGELSEGTFENTFAKQDGAWRIQSVHFYPRMIVDAATGWGRSAKPAPGPSTDFPPDRRPTSLYAIYPKFAVAPFHFDNPVTGRPPQYPEGVQAVRPSASPMPTSAPAIRNRAELEDRLGEVERLTATAEAYDAVENLIGAFGYGRDGAALSDGGKSFVSQILQPVIEIARDGRSAKTRARLLELRGTSGGAGSWVAGMYNGSAVQQDGSWKLQMLDLEGTWSGPFPGGWARVP